MTTSTSPPALRQLESLLAEAEQTRDESKSIWEQAVMSGDGDEQYRQKVYVTSCGICTGIQYAIYCWKRSLS